MDENDDETFCKFSFKSTLTIIGSKRNDSLSTHKEYFVSLHNI